MTLPVISRSRNHYGRVAAAGAVLTVMLSALFLWLATGRFLKVDVSPAGTADAIYTLAGDYRETNPEAVRLFRAGLAPRIIVYNDAIFSSWSQAHQHNLYEVEWAEEDLVQRGIPRSAIVRLPFVNYGTRFEAIALRRYLRDQRMNRIILVMHDYHARRTLMTFRRILGDTPQLLPATIPSSLSPNRARAVYLTEAAKIFFYTCWLNGPYRFMAPEDIDGASSRSRTEHPRFLWRSTKPLEVGSTKLANATLGVLYAATLVVRGGVGPFTVAVEEGALPPGLTLNDRFMIRGTPREPGTYPFTAVITDGAGFTVRTEYRLRVDIRELAVSTTELHEGSVGAGYAARLTASGGVPPYHWREERPLPQGLALTGDGMVTGSPQVPGTFQVAVRVRDAAGRMAVRQLLLRVVVPSLTVAPRLSPSLQRV